MQIKYEVGETPQQWHGKLYVSSGQMRFDLQNSPHEGPIVLTNFATQTDDVLLPPMKAYVEHRIDDSRSRGPALGDARFTILALNTRAGVLIRLNGGPS
jgi:hypothetical protein